MKKISLKSGIERIYLGAMRFPLTLVFVFGLAICLFLEINGHNVKIQESYWTLLGLGIPLSLSAALFTEDLKNRFLKIALNLLAIILLFSYCYFLPEKLLSYQFYQITILGMVFTLSSFIVSYLAKNKDIPFWEFSKKIVIQLIIATLFSQILMAGLSLAVLSLDELFKIKINPDVYANLAVICYAIFAPVYFLSNIPNKNEKQKQEYTFNKFFKILGLYILLPILGLYCLILYVYLTQIIVHWKLPNGWVSMLVSILSIGGLICLMILYPLRMENKNKIIKFFSKYFNLLLLPLLVLMSIGIYRRISDYGITIDRCYILIFNVWLYGISIYLFLSKAKHIKWIVVSFATVALLTSVGPLSVFNVTKKALVKEIGQMLNEAKLLENGKVIGSSRETKKLDVKTSNALAEKISYVCDNFGNESLQKYFTNSIQNKTNLEINDFLGLESSVDNEEYFYATMENNQSIDIEPYKTLLPLEYNGETETVFTSDEMKIIIDKYAIIVTQKAEKKPIVISLKEEYERLIKEKKDSYTAKEMSLTGENYKLVISNISGRYFPENDSISLNNIDANLFLK